MKKLLFVLFIILVPSFIITSSSYASFGEKEYMPCGSLCHTPPVSSLGIHNYVGTSDTCSVCHKPHDAWSSYKLLPAATQSKICFTCHDGTTGNLDGDTDNSHVIFGQVSNADVDADNAARHTVDITTETSITVTGSASGVSIFGTITVPYGTELSGPLNCSSCHTPHGFNTISDFTSKRDGAFHSSNHKILKQKPGDATVAVAYYGTSWCNACHNSAFGGSMPDHPMSTTTPYSYPLDHGVTPTPENRPICMSCHDDARNVANFPGTTETTQTLTNFPHESTNDKFLVENGDTLCLNCHSTSGLP